ncbi:VOC family protein [Roseisalinus antarcticus]|uniref:Glyoxalase/Bleomycin resistance protein/Dioxygenase superfamily protein n=1 Tax=Roseisalinus antarcticus TaxID=254357 RepID=A0A1Y5SH54_9RHOB|nr:VOC family protein [Roseisalinus antarcticus]SLN40385.1 Glyoxalase/Bleomycin resistance protein/Dioxygenase superfamily protein [Roseisalinus antarcticus]
MGLGLITLVVPDYDPAIDYFTRALGFELVEDSPAVSSRDPGREKRWVVVRPPGAGAALLLARADSKAERARIGDQTGGRVGFFMETDDFARDHAHMLAEGVAFLEEPRVAPYGTVAVFRDICGNLWDLIERR